MEDKKIYALDIAKYIIAFLDSKGDLISNKKLQKLLYYVQAWNLVIFDDSIFDERPQAWVHGPVYPSVYAAFKNFGYSPISIESDYQNEGLSSEEWIEKYKKQLFSEEQALLTEEVLLKYGEKSAFALEILTHKEYPWIEQREGLGEFDMCDKPISFETIKSYYSQKRKNK